MTVEMREAEVYRKGYRVRADGQVTNPAGRCLKGWYHEGYYTFSAGRAYKNIPAHRLVAYQKFGDALFEEGIEVRHLDGNSHNNSFENIIIGTKFDNYMDKRADTRIRVALAGADAVRKLDDDKAAKLRADRLSGMKYKELTAKYGLAKSTVSYVVNKKTYNR